jgi:hypothetical protein
MSLSGYSSSLALYDYLYARLAAVRIFKRRLQALKGFHRLLSPYGPVECEVEQGAKKTGHPIALTSNQIKAGRVIHRHGRPEKAAQAF